MNTVWKYILNAYNYNTVYSNLVITFIVGLVIGAFLEKWSHAKKEEKKING